MPHFKNSTNELFWLDESDVEAWKKPEWTQIDDSEAEQIRQANIPPHPIPLSVTMRQARLALLNTGHLAGVDAAIAAIPDDIQRQAAQIEWEYAQTVDRNAPFTQTLALALGLSDADLDALFTAAAAL